MTTETPELASWPMEQVCQVEDLQVGDNIQAWHNGKIYHTGSVLRTIPSLGLITLLTSDGTKVRLVDAEVFPVVRTQEPELLPA